MNWRKLLRLEQRAAEDQAERGEILVPAHAGMDRPFGVKALDEGSSIEGVWNARTTTTLHGPTSKNRSPLISPAKMFRRSRRNTSVSSIPSLDIAESLPAAKVMHTLPSTQSRDAADHLKMLTSLEPSKEEVSSSPATLPKRKKANSITISYSGPSSRPKPAESNAVPEVERLLGRSSRSPLMHRTYQVSGGLVSAESTEPAMQPKASPPKLRLRPSFSVSNTKRRKFIIGPRTSLSKAPEKPVKNENDVIERMNAHRRLHSAEQGQLVPRVRPHSEDNARVEIDYCTCGERDSSPSRAISWPTNDSVRLSKRTPPEPPTAIPPPATAQTSATETPRPPKPCPSAWTGRTQEMLDEQLTRDVSAGESLNTPSLCSDATLTTAAITDDHISIENKTTRKINQGFEILPAGSLQKEAELKVVELWPEVVKKESDKKKPNKLQKRHRRSSSASSRESRSSSESMRSSRFALLLPGVH